jgi:hypothetical protein
MSEKVHYRLVKKIKDELLNVDEISSYNLYLQISNHVFRFCITDVVKNRCLHLEDYKISFISHPNQLIQQLERLYDEHHLLKAGFWKSIWLAVKNVNFSLVPNSLFDKNFLKEYISINTSLCSMPDEAYYYYTQKSTDAVNIFSADKKIVDWFSKTYPSKNIRVVHYTSSLIEGVMIHGSEERLVYLQVEQNYVTIIVKHKKTLEFCNSFYFYTAEDFIYFVMFVFEQLQLSQEETEVVVWGEITPDSLVYNKLIKYIRNVSLGEKPSSMKFGYSFDEIMDHNFFDLYAMHLCE